MCTSCRSCLQGAQIKEETNHSYRCWGINIIKDLAVRRDGRGRRRDGGGKKGLGSVGKFIYTYTYRYILYLADAENTIFYSTFFFSPRELTRTIRVIMRASSFNINRKKCVWKGDGSGGGIDLLIMHIALRIQGDNKTVVSLEPFSVHDNQWARPFGLFFFLNTTTHVGS